MVPHVICHVPLNFIPFRGLHFHNISICGSDRGGETAQGEEAHRVTDNMGLLWTEGGAARLKQGALSLVMPSCEDRVS